MPDETRRLFLALWPDDGLRRQLAQRREALGAVSGRAVPSHNLHLTLVFLGDQPTAELPRVVSAADRVATASFDLLLDRSGWFARARVAWLGGAPVEGGLALVGALAQALSQRAVSFDRRDWRPHVTLWRRVVRQPCLREPVPLTWPVREFSLIESNYGRPYQVLRTWPLQ